MIRHGYREMKKRHESTLQGSRDTKGYKLEEIKENQKEIKRQNRGDLQLIMKKAKQDGTHRPMKYFSLKKSAMKSYPKSESDSAARG